MNYLCTKIEWDTEDSDTGLRIPVDLPLSVLIIGIGYKLYNTEEELGDFLSDTYGYCHKGFEYNELEGKSGQLVGNVDVIFW